MRVILLLALMTTLSVSSYASEGYKGKELQSKNLEAVYGLYMSVKVGTEVMGVDSAQMCDRDDKLKSLKSVVKRIEKMILSKYPKINSDELWSNAYADLLKIEEFQLFVRMKGKGKNDWNAVKECNDMFVRNQMILVNGEHEVREALGLSSPKETMKKDF